MQDMSDPFSDPMLAEVVTRKLLQGADHPWELEQPPKFDPIEACERFMRLSAEVNRIVNDDCPIELWPAIRAATFHGEIVLPASAMAEPASAIIRASNFGNLITILDDERTVKPEILALLRRRFERIGYRYIPALPLRKAYDGHHRATRQFTRWSDRLFGYV